MNLEARDERLIWAGRLYLKLQKSKLAFVEGKVSYGLHHSKIPFGSISIVCTVPLFIICIRSSSEMKNKCKLRVQFKEIVELHYFKEKQSKRNKEEKSLKSCKSNKTFKFHLSPSSIV